MLRRNLLLTLLYLPLTAAPMPKGNPEEAGISAERLQNINGLMRRYIDSSDIAGSVTLVARKKRKPTG